MVQPVIISTSSLYHSDVIDPIETFGEVTVVIQDPSLWLGHGISPVAPQSAMWGINPQALLLNIT